MRNRSGPYRGRNRETAEQAIPFKQSWGVQGILGVVDHGVVGKKEVSSDQLENVEANPPVLADSPQQSVFSPRRLLFAQFGATSGTDTTLVHNSMTVIRQRLPESVFDGMFEKIFSLLRERGLLKGKSLGVGAITLDASAAMNTIVRTCCLKSFDTVGYWLGGRGRRR